MNRPMRGVLLSLFFFLGLVSISLYGSITVAPLSLRSNVEPGQSDLLSFVIRNTGDEDADVTVTLHDWWRTIEGGFLIFAPETLERSCAGWTVYSHELLTLEPGKEQIISVELLVPETVVGDHWAVLLVEEQPKPVEQEQADEGLTNTTRVVVTYAVKILYVDPVHRNPNAEIREIVVLEEDPLQINVHFANAGTAHITTSGVVEVRDIFGETVRSFDVDPFPTLPDEEKLLMIQDESEVPLPDGLYYVVAVFDFGGDHLIQGGLQLEVERETESDGS